MKRNIHLPVAASVAALLAVLVAAACAGTKQPPREVGGLDRKLSTFAFIEDGNLIALIVDTRPARYSEEAQYMPLEIAIANRGLKELVLTRESFTLVDDSGNRYPAATPQELLDGYEYLDIDRNQLTELGGILTTKLAVYHAYPSRFSPTRSGGTVVLDRVVLPRFGFLIDYLYFPEPESGIRGHEFELFVDSQSLTDPVFVKFAVE